MMHLSMHMQICSHNHTHTHFHTATPPPSTSSLHPPPPLSQLGLQFRHPQRFGGCRRTLIEGATFALDTARLIATDKWSHLGPSASRTEAPANSAQSRLWWLSTVTGVVVTVVGVQRLAVMGLSRSQSWREGLGGARLVEWTDKVASVFVRVGVPMGAGFVLGSMATLQRLWF